MNQEYEDFRKWLDFGAGILSREFRTHVEVWVQRCMAESFGKGEASAEASERLDEAIASLVEDCERAVLDVATRKAVDGHYLSNEEQDAAAFDAHVEFRNAVKELIGMED